MSVINKMLQDLEKRQSGEVTSDLHTGATILPQKKSRRWLRLLTLITLPVMLGVAGYYYWMMQKQLTQYEPLLEQVSANETVHEIKATDKNALTSALETPDGNGVKLTQTNTIKEALSNATVSDALNRGVHSKQADAVRAIAERIERQPKAVEHNNALEQTQDVITQLVNTNKANEPTVDAMLARLPENTAQNERETTNTSVSVTTASGNTPTTQNVPEKKSMANVNLADSQKAPQVEKSSFSVTTVTVSAEQLAEKEFLIAESYKNRVLLEDAATHYQQALKHWPTHTKSRVQLSALLYAKNESEQALQVLEQGLALATNNEELAVVAAKISMKLGAFNRGLAYLSGISLENTLNVSAIALRANLGQKAKAFELALADYDVLLRTNPRNARWLLGKAISLDMLGRKPEAVLVYQQVLSVGGVSLASKQYVMNRLQALRDKSNG